MAAVGSLGSRVGLAIVVAVALEGCGDGSGSGDAGIDARRGDDAAVVVEDDAGQDAGAPDAPVFDAGRPDAGPRCGDGHVDAMEECDDGNHRPNDGCTAGCLLECGDGFVSGMETCDTAIAAGRTGACPTSCDDGMVCTTDTLVGTDCSAECVATPITDPSDDDGCCPPGATSLTDRDCPVVCGNRALEAGEVCDTGILSGPGACPTVCSDAIACTLDVLENAGTCDAKCLHTEITMEIAGDLCCPAHATVSTDADCSPECGDMVVSSLAGETCDIGIASGEGACPTSCDDGMVCTGDVLVGAGTCTATCSHTVLTPHDGDGCCPEGATIASDADCPVRCGDGVRTAPEACDDGNLATGDGCSPTCTREPRAYRFSQLGIQDPRIINSSGVDVTPEVNTALRNAVTMDMYGLMGTPDGWLDLSVVMRFDPLDQDAASVPGVVDFAACPAPLSSCMEVTPAATVFTNLVVGSAGSCIGALPGTIPPGRVVNTPTAPCFSTSDVGVFTIGLAGSAIHFQHTQLGAQYLGDPASRLVTGLVRGFLPESEAAGIVIGGSALAENLRASDRDTLDGVVGWWFYLSFVAEPVAYVP
ncbi:MAG: DUF4215 domain-containing protein [Sandaracinaceae bacterium]|nr:DUF4215 domain-containing protein [Sandaracinaceae bacterium]